jgi:hypothetical protein
MQIEKMSVSGRQHIVGGWLQMYEGAGTEGKNGIVRQCTTSFPAFSSRMRNNLRVIGVDKAFERSITEAIMGTEPVRRGRRR